MSNKLSIAATLKMWAEQKGRCIFCSRTLILNHKQLSPTIEHRIPSSKGGKDTASNYCISCNECNSLRGNMLMEEFMNGNRFYFDKEKMEKSMVKFRGPKKWYHGDYIKW